MTRENLPPRRPVPELSNAGRVGRLLLSAALIAAVVTLLARRQQGLAVTAVATVASVASDGGDLAERASFAPPRDLAAPPSPRTAPSGSSWSPPRSAEELVRARADRDKLRERIYRAFGQPPPDEAPPSPSGHAPYAPMPELDGGQIDPAYIRDVVHDDYFPLARSCYAELMSRSPDAGGRLTFDFTIVGNPQIGGIVERADIAEGSTIDDPAMVTCMRESMLSMTFAPPPSGGSVTVTYPIDFAPDDGDR